MALVAVVVVVVVVVAVLIGCVVYAVASPYARVPVSAACTESAAAATAAAQTIVPGVGEGTRLATDGVTEVAVVTPGSGGTAASAIYVVTSGRVVARVPMASQAAAGAVEDGIAYLFDDKLGYVLDATTGASLPRLFETDNYRGLYTDAGVEYLQTDAEITAFGLAGVPFSSRIVRFGAMAYGCVVAELPGGG